MVLGRRRRGIFEFLGGSDLWSGFSLRAGASQRGGDYYCLDGFGGSVDYNRSAVHLSGGGSVVERLFSLGPVVKLPL